MPLQGQYIHEPEDEHLFNLYHRHFTSLTLDSTLLLNEDQELILTDAELQRRLDF